MVPKHRNRGDIELTEAEDDGTTNATVVLTNNGCVATAEEQRAEMWSDGSSSDFGVYQCLLFLFTQLGYLAVAPSMLSTTFFEPSSAFCDTFRLSSSPNGSSSVFTLFSSPPSVEFHSLLMEWGEHCLFSVRTVWMSSAVMVGAVVGAFVAGFVADCFGRKPVVVGSMALISVANSLIALFGASSPPLALSLFVLLGLACGAYMVTNMVLLIEILRHSSTRLLAVSLNGWPLGMVGTALLAFAVRHWRFYHLAVSVASLFLFIIIHYLAFESIPWLIQSGNHRRAHSVQQNLFKVNSFLATKDGKKTAMAPFGVNGVAAPMTRSSSPLNNCSLNENTDDALLEESEEGTQPAAHRQRQRIYTYLDLFRHRSVCVRMLTLLFCFGSSAVISFGLYFSTEVLPGSRYLNIAMMGLGKLVLGFLPFLLSNRIGRRPILLVSVGLACLACWALVIGWLFFNLSKHWLTAALGLFITAAIDPNWKIIHLLSMELFPTPVCNMSCALCNVIACLGSLSVPLVQFLRSLNGVFPFWLFGIFLTIQWLISFFFLPEKTTTLVDKGPLQRLSSLFMCMRGDDYHWLTKQPFIMTESAGTSIKAMLDLGSQLHILSPRIAKKLQLRIDGKESFLSASGAIVECDYTNQFAVQATDTEGNERTISFGRTLIGDFCDKRFDMIVGMSITQCTIIDLKKDIWERSDDEKYQIFYPPSCESLP